MIPSMLVENYIIWFYGNFLRFNRKWCEWRSLSSVHNWRNSDTVQNCTLIRIAQCTFFSCIRKLGNWDRRNLSLSIILNYVGCSKSCHTWTLFGVIVLKKKRERRVELRRDIFELLAVINQDLKSVWAKIFINPILPSLTFTFSFILHKWNRAKRK